jgi:NAD+ kinase
MGRNVFTVKKAVLIVNLSKKNSASAAELIQSELKRNGIETTVLSFQGKPPPPPEGEWDIAFSLGGDGTVLYTARCFAPLGIPILPVNLGSLGFIAGVVNEKWLEVFRRFNDCEIIPSRRCMLEIIVRRNSEVCMKNICLNEIVISADGIAKLINLDTHLYFNLNEKVNLGSYRCDGLIIATPTGSTAHSMAAGGPILDPEMEAVILNPICPFTLSSRPVVLPSQQAVEITVTQEQRSGVLLTVDGQDTFNLECGDIIKIQQSSKPALLISADRHIYYSALRKKLFWSGDAFYGGIHA